jgi:hypothetical protein
MNGCGVLLLLGIRGNQNFVRRRDALEFGIGLKRVEIETAADLNIPLRQIVAVNENLTDLVGCVGVLAFLWVVILNEVSFR